jgi:hypothetical protein
MLLYFFDKKVRVEMSVKFFLGIIGFILAVNFIAIAVGTVFLLKIYVPTEYAKIESEMMSEKKQIEEQKNDLSKIEEDIIKRFMFLSGKTAEESKGTAVMKQQKRKAVSQPTVQEGEQQ